MTISLALKNELIRLFARKRTYMGFAVFILTEMVIVALLHTAPARAQLNSAMGRTGLEVEEFFSGLTLATIILAVSVAFLAHLFIALVGGDIVAKDTEDGTMRMILSRPITRFRLLTAKWISAMVYAAVLILFIGITSLISGFLFRGVSDTLFVYNADENIFAFFRGAEAFRHFSLALLVLLAPASLVAGLAFMLSCFNIRPAAATVLTLAVLFADMVLSNIPYFRPFQTWFIQHHLNCWIRTFHPIIPWWDIGGSLLYLLALNGTFFTVGVLVFSSRDLK